MLRHPLTSWAGLLGLAIGYVLLDWVSNIHPLYGLNITPWNPAPALALVFLLRFGAVAGLPVIAAIMADDVLLRQSMMPLVVSALLALQLVLSYWGIAELLRRRLFETGVFSTLRGLLEWSAIAAAGTMAGSLLFTASLVWLGLIPASDARAVCVQFWVGDGIGVLVSMPVFWMLFDERGRAQLRAVLVSREASGYLAATSAALWIAFGAGLDTDFKYFYVLFLPVVWAAVRHGLAGAVFTAALLQIGVIGVAQWIGFDAPALRDIQTLVVVLVLLGFFVGVVVDEKQRLSAELRQTLRLAAAGEMAGALAHELNQPLTALSAYGSACEQLLAMGETGERLRATIARMVAESFRAAEVVRRLRDFFRTGATHLEMLPLSELLVSVQSSFLEKARAMGIDMTVVTAASATLLADRLQLEVVLRNLVTNAFDAVSAQPPGNRRVQVSSRTQGDGQVCISVEDNGPGISGAAAARLFEAFQSSKSSGLGLGLAISRAIVEAHGGQLVAEVAAHGLFKLILPTEGRTGDGK